MCGIFSYSGRGDAVKIIHKGLQRLEYRGYDSWGISVLNKQKITTYKTIYPLNTEPKLPIKTNVGIGHTRWATHGGVTHTNAHPHVTTTKEFAIAQNGIVENFETLKKVLIQKGHKFKSQTDTEVILKLIEVELKNKNLFDAARAAFKKLKGRNTVIIVSNSGEIIGIKNGSPLVVGKKADEYFVASDVLSFSDRADKNAILEDGELVHIVEGNIEFRNVSNGKLIDKKWDKISLQNTEVSKENYGHYMIKEIYEQIHSIKNPIQITEKELRPLVNAIKKSNNVYTIGAGTAGYAAGQIAYFLRKVAKVNAIALKPYEAESYYNIFSKKDLIIALSQSGETADTLEVLEIAKEKGLKIASLVNMQGSTTTRISDYPYYLKTGPEICVASTKAFTAKLAWGYLLAKSLIGEFDKAKREINKLSKTLDKTLTKNFEDNIRTISKKLLKHEHMFVLGRGLNFNIALEGSLKVKEVSYKHFEGFSAGELKHGVIALVEKGTPVFGIISNDEEKENIVSAMMEVKARGGWTIGIGNKPKDTQVFDDFIETKGKGLLSSINNVIPFQMIGYYLAILQDFNPDKPRNLAKSVTVK